jgi:hypothetical protein
MPKPHLTNRYLNLMEFLAEAFPREMEGYLQKLDVPTRERLALAIKHSPHRNPPSEAKKSSQTLVAAVVMVAALALSTVVALTGRAGLEPEALDPTGGGSVSPEPTFDSSPTPTPFPTPTPTPTESPFSFPEDTLEPSVTGALTGVIPSRVLPSCTAGPILPPNLAEGAVAAVYCTPPDVDELYYIEYQDSGSLQQAFVTTERPPTDNPRCDAGPSTHSYTIGGEDAGVLSCYMAEPNIEFVWTVESERILGVIVDDGLGFAALYEAWLGL